MTDKHDDKAREIVDRWFASLPTAKRPYLESLNVLYGPIAAALRSAARVQPGHVRDGDTDRKVLGTLPVTADGCVVGMGATVWNALIPGHPSETTHRTTLWSDTDEDSPKVGVIVFARPGLAWWSTKEAAEDAGTKHTSAAEAAKKGGG